MKLQVGVRAEGENNSFFAEVEVAEPLVRAFARQMTTDDVLLSWATRGQLKGNAVDEQVIRFREEAAREIADALTEILVQAMRSGDTHNGYPVTDKKLTK